MLGKPVFTNKIVAKNLGIDEKKVTDVMDFFFSELGKEIRECNHPFIYVRGLGTFTLKTSTIESRLRVNITRYRTLRKKRPEERGRGTATSQAFLDGARKEIFELFRIRRLIKGRRKENQKIKDAKKAGSTVHDIQG